VVLAGDRHQFTAGLFRRGIEGNREFGAHLGFAQFLNPWDDSGGRKRDAALGHADAPRIGQQAGGLENVLQVQQWLAHPHHHDVEARIGLQQAVVARHEKHLPHDFTGCKVSFESHEGGHAEFAVHRATHLARNADGVALAFRHQNGLDGTAVGEFEEVPPRAVHGAVTLVDLRQSKLVGFRQTTA